MGTTSDEGGRIKGLCNHVFSDDVHASIKNRLGNGKSMMVHCQSKDNDLGLQNVTDGSEFGWDFSPNVWGTTQFYCNLEWVKCTAVPI
ncbi:hypothetical protein L1049_005578 [Liquidambar formosana]|uniref:S-protein homolog n=1 Tax=Liquidambar formosana TaxID=63359 RepID=A0AAP0RFJ7_LIQFO